MYTLHSRLNTFMTVFRTHENEFNIGVHLHMQERDQQS